MSNFCFKQLNTFAIDMPKARSCRYNNCSRTGARDMKLISILKYNIRLCLPVFVEFCTREIQKKRSTLKVKEVLLLTYMMLYTCVFCCCCLCVSINKIISPFAKDFCFAHTYFVLWVLCVRTMIRFT